MPDERVAPNVLELEIVHRYATELRRTACGVRRRPAEPSVRRCYELVNQCAMELAELTRRDIPSGPSASN
jgi:hypothetical protein